MDRCVERDYDDHRVILVTTKTFIATVGEQKKLKATLRTQLPNFKDNCMLILGRNGLPAMGLRVAKWGPDMWMRTSVDSPKERGPRFVSSLLFS